MVSKYICPTCKRKLIIEGNERLMDDRAIPMVSPRGAAIIEHDCLLDHGLTIVEYDKLMADGKLIQG